MKLPIDAAALTALVRRMGAQESQWRLGDSLLPPLDTAALAGRGIEIDLTDIEVTKEGLLSYRGEQIILYIREPKQGADRATLLHRPQDGPRFHVADCKVLDSMRSQGRFERYVVTNNKSGRFTVVARDQRGRPAGEVDAELKVCKQCLMHLGYKGYSDHRWGASLWKAFALSEFFETYATRFRSKPRFTDKTAPPPGYSDDWPQISARYRASVGWKCEQCRVSLVHHKGLLHTHHINGVTGDNQNSNLRALCAVCHAKQPAHAMMVRGDQRALIENLRKKSGQE